ncbi:MAG: MFS transporter [Burkholderiales bacterium]|nr:MFS transporter [Burkholderiales bacterium]
MRRIFYGWKIVGTGATLQALQAALIGHAFGAYVAVLAADMGWSKTSLSGAAALQQMETALLGPLIGWAMDRYGPRRFIRAGVLLLGLGLVAMSRAQSLAGFYGAFAVIALGASLAGFFPLNVAIIHWFERKRARAISALSFGLAVGGMLVPLVAAAIDAFGWRRTALASGLLYLVLAVPLARVFRDRPADVGAVADGERTAPGADPAAARAGAREATRDFTWREAIATRAFWLLSLGHAFALFAVHAVLVHAIVHLRDSLGYPLAAAASVVTLVTVAQVGGIALGWAIGDRFDKRLLCAGCMLAHASGLALLAFAQNAAMVAAFALLHGVAWGLRGPFMQAIRADYFGPSSIGMILGLSFMVVLVGQVGGPMIPGLLADATGDYRAGFALLAALAGIGSVFFLLAKKPPRPARAPRDAA